MSPARPGRTARSVTRVEFRAQVVLPVRYVLDLACDPAARAVDWTFVEGEIVTNSVGSWRFSPRGRRRRSTTAWRST